MSNWWDSIIAIEGDATGTLLPNEDTAEWLKSLDCPIKLCVERHSDSAELLLEDYTWTEVDGEIVVELRPEDAQRVAEFLAKGG